MSRFSPRQWMVPALSLPYVESGVVVALLSPRSPRYGVEFGDPCRMEQRLSA